MPCPRSPVLFLAVSVLLTLPLCPAIAGDAFRRGDANADGEIDVSDPVRVALALYAGGFDLECLDAADSNDDGAVDVSDVVHLLAFLFRGGRAPPEPFSSCGIDPTSDSLGCQRHEPCAAVGPPETVVNADVVVLDPAATEIISADESTVAISGSLGGLGPGKVLVSGEGMGLLRRVESVEPSGDGYLLRTSGATLEDVFEEADIESESTLDLGDVQRLEPEVEGVTLVRPEAGGDGGGAAASPSGETELEITPVTIQVAPGVQLTLSTKVTVKLQVGLAIRISRNMLGVPKLQRFLFNPGLTVEGKVTAKLAAAVEVPVFEKRLWTGYLTPIVIAAGPVPVVVTPVIEAFVKMNAKGEVGIELGPKLTVAAQGRIAYDPVAGWTSGAPAPQVQFDPGLVPNVYASISAEVALAPRISFLLYGIVGPYVELATPFLKAEVKEQTTPPQWEFSVDAGLKMLVGVQAAALGQGVSYSAEVIKLSTNIHKKVYPLDPCAPDPDDPNARKFIRGDVNHDLRLDMSDITQLLWYIVSGTPAPIDCSGAVNLDVADVNDNEHVTLTDALQLAAYLFEGGPPPAQPGNTGLRTLLVPGIDPDESTRGFDRLDPGYAVRAAGMRIVDGRLLLDLEVKSPSPVAGFVLAMKAPSSLDPEPALILPAESSLDMAVLPGINQVFGRQDGEQETRTVGMQLATVPSFLSGGTNGAFLPLCSVAFTDHDAAAPIWFEWLPVADLHGMSIRAAVIDEAFADHHPVLSMDAVPLR